MKKAILILLALFAVTPQIRAQSLDKSFGLIQRYWIDEEEGYNPVARAQYPPADGANGLLFWEGAAGIPYTAAFGDKFTYNSTTKTVNVTGFEASGAAATAQAAAVQRANHTGTQAISTVTGLQTALDGKQAVVSSIAINNTPGRSVVTVAAAANGWQPSATKFSTVSYSVTI